VQNSAKASVLGAALTALIYAQGVDLGGLRGL